MFDETMPVDLTMSHVEHHDASTWLDEPNLRQFLHLSVEIKMLRVYQTVCLFVCLLACLPAAEQPRQLAS